MSVEASSDFSAAVPSSSFGPLRQIDAGSLNVGYVDVSPAAICLGYRENRREFNKLIWQIASPKWDFDDGTFERTAASFDNPDHVDIVIHNYRRLSLAQGEPQYGDLEARLFERPMITVPTVTMGSASTGPMRRTCLCGEFSGACTRIESSKASDTTSPKKPRTRSPTPYSKSEEEWREFL